jgi:hypothetical protein
MWAWLGVALLLLDGAIHLWLAPDQFKEATYEGVLFLANGAGAVIASAAIIRGLRAGWQVGALVAAGGAVAYLVSRTLGLPTLPRDPAWQCPYGFVSVAAELLFVWVAVRVFGAWQVGTRAPAAVAHTE